MTFYVTIPAVLRVEFEADDLEHAERLIEASDLPETMDHILVDLMHCTIVFADGEARVSPQPDVFGHYYIDDGPVAVE